MSCLKKFLVAAIILAFPAIVYPQIKAPVVEDVPDVEFNIEESSEKFKASVTLYGREKINGEIMLPAGAGISPEGNSGRIYIFRDINRITVKEWSKQRRGTGWIFFPSGYEIILKDQTRVHYRGNLVSLNRLRFIKSGGGETALYSYFYDYFRNGKWFNTGLEGEDSSPVRPAAGTVYIIELK